MDLSWAPFAAMYAALLVALRNYNSKVLELIRSREADIESVKDLVSEFSASCRIICDEKLKLARLHCSKQDVFDGDDKSRVLDKIDSNYDKCVLLKEMINTKAPDSIYKKNSLSIKMETEGEGALRNIERAAEAIELLLSRKDFIKEKAKSRKNRRNDSAKGEEGGENETGSIQEPSSRWRAFVSLINAVSG